MKNLENGKKTPAYKNYLLRQIMESDRAIKEYERRLFVYKDNESLFYIRKFIKECIANFKRCKKKYKLKLENYESKIN